MKPLRQIAAVICLISTVASSLPLTTFAQEATPGTDTGTGSITQSSDTPAPSDSGASSDNSGLPASSPLDFNINPGGSPNISTESPALSTSPADNSSPVSDASPSPSPETSPSAPQTLSSDLSTSPINEVFNSQRPLPTEINENTGGFMYTYPIAVPPG